MADEGNPKQDLRQQRRRNLRMLLMVLGWAGIWLWFKIEADYPRSFGIHEMRGKGGMIQEYWDSYLLVRRHHGWDIALFGWMWAPVGRFGGKAVHGLWKARGKPRFSLFAQDASPPAGQA